MEGCLQRISAHPAASHAPWSSCRVVSEGLRVNSLTSLRHSPFSLQSIEALRSALSPKLRTRRSIAVNCCLQQNDKELVQNGSQGVRPLSSESGSMQPEGDSRRQFLSSMLTLFVAGTAAFPGSSEAAGGLSKYIKKKKLDPLETYVPVVLLSRDQLEELGQELVSENLDAVSARKLLRSGPASTLRNDMRAVAQYASEGGDGGSASTFAEQCLEELSDVDSILLRLSRGDSNASLATAKDKLATAIADLDSVLATVPEPIFTKGKAVAAAYRESLKPESDGEETVPGNGTVVEARDFI